MSGDIYVHDTMTGGKVKFEPLLSGKVGMYCCGPTTYNFPHLGNGRPMVVFDTIRRYLLHKGYDVTYVSNFTDVDDKIIDKAISEGKSPSEISERYTRECYAAADALGVSRADVHPLVSEHMPEIIAFVEDLVSKDLAYPLDGDVYYSVSKFPEYGKLSKRDIEDLLEGARVDVDHRKRDAADFALWKKVKPGEPYWESPWGPGRPGWHIECSAMSHKYLGESFDIHGGGSDLIFPHHENEIAQSEGRFEKPMAKYWIHNGFITVNQEVMSKSKGNFFTLKDIFEEFEGPVVRFYLLSAHYRSPLDFDNEKLAMAKRGLERLKNAARAAKAVIDQREGTGASVGVDAEASVKAFTAEIDLADGQFHEAMNDDFNSALAIAALFDMSRAINAYTAESAPDIPALKHALERFVTLAGVLGFDLTAGSGARDEGEDEKLSLALSELIAELGGSTWSDNAIDDKMRTLLSLRKDFRVARDYSKADKIRDGLKDLGLIVEDTAQGARWHRV